MTAYLIVYGKDPTDRLAAYAFLDRITARRGSLTRLVPRVPPDGSAGGCAYVVEAIEDVSFSTPLIVAVYNGLAPTDGHVNRFESRTVAQQRLLALLALQAQPPDGVAPTEESVIMSVESDAPRRRGRAPGAASFAEDAHITILVPNPKRVGTKAYEKFEKYQNGMTVTQARGHGYSTKDLTWDRDHSYISIA